MKIFFKSLILVLFATTSLQTQAIDPKVMAIGKSAAYGTVAGTLLGTATLAFGGGGRNIAKGASLGLYAGLIFGGYVIASYEMKKRGWGNEKNSEDYYPDARDSYDGASNSIFNQFDELYGNANEVKGKKEGQELSFAVPVLHYQF